MISLSLNIYLFATSQQTQRNNEQRERLSTSLLEQSVEIMLREEVYISDKERMQRSSWILLFEKYGVESTNYNVQSITIPLDNKQVLDLLPNSSTPFILEKAEDTYQIVYDIGDKRIELAYTPDDTITKRINLLFKNSEYLVSYTNFNNQKFTPYVSFQLSRH